MKSAVSLLAGTAGLMFALGGAASAMECEDLPIGSAISLTGKYATNGVHSQTGTICHEKIKENGGVKIGDKCYNFVATYYDDESKGDRAATLAERLINQDKMQYLSRAIFIWHDQGDRACDRKVQNPHG